MTEIAPIIGSLAQYDVISLVEAGVLIPLFESLSAVDYKVVEASARALRQIVQHPLPISFDSISVSDFEENCFDVVASSLLMYTILFLFQNHLRWRLPNLWFIFRK